MSRMAWIVMMLLLSVSYVFAQEQHEGHEGEDKHEDLVHLSAQDIKDFDIQLSVVSPGNLVRHISLTGEVKANANHEAHIAPRFSGLVVDVKKEQGEKVAKGETLALIEANDSLNTYELKSLIAGTILKKHITLGEVSGNNSVAFVVANLDTVWIHLNVYQKDLAYIRKGAKVIVSAQYGVPDREGVISYVSPIIDEKTRTTVVRVEMSNTEGLFRPGMYVKAYVFADNIKANLVILQSALQVVENRLSVFIRDGDSFRPQAVLLGREDERFVEVLGGLLVGQKYVAKGSFVLKAELEKESFGDGHNH